MHLWQQCYRSDATFLLYPIKWLMILFVPWLMTFSWWRWCLSSFFIVKWLLLPLQLINVLLSWSYASTLFLIKLSVYSFINVYELTVFPFYSGLYNLLHNVILVNKISYIWPERVPSTLLCVLTPFFHQFWALSCFLSNKMFHPSLCFPASALNQPLSQRALAHFSGKWI